MVNNLRALVIGGVPLLSHVSLQLFRKAQISGKNRRRHTAFLLGEF